MKTFIMALKLFKRHLLLNLLLIIELAAVTVVAVVAVNMVKSSTACITTLQNSCDSIMYCVNPGSFTPGESLESINKNYKAKIKKTVKNFKFVKGYSKIVNSFITFDKGTLKTMTFTKNNYADVIAVDDETAKAVQYPLAGGRWFSTKAVGGCVPCVIGGVNSDKYHIGQKLTGYALTDSKGKKIKRITFVVTGCLAKPEQVVDTSQCTSGNTLAVSTLFKSRVSDALFIIAPTSLTGNIISDHMDTGNVFMYLDRSTTKSKISALRNKLTRNFTFTADELIANENKQLAQNISIILPFIVMLLLVSLCGVVSMCMLTTLRNMETFKIYYLTGCPRYKTVVATGIYSLFYFIGAGILFFAAMNYLYAKTGDLMTKANFIIYPQALLLVGVCVMLVCLLSFVIPFFILRQQKPADLLRAN